MAEFDFALLLCSSGEGCLELLLEDERRRVSSGDLEGLAGEAG